jgi:hypothetical protein
MSVEGRRAPSFRSLLWSTPVTGSAAKQAGAAQSGLGLKDVVPVREGLGASLYWSPIRTSMASDSEAHFRELCESLRLERSTVPTAVH